VKARFRVAALPATETETVLHRIRTLFPQANGAGSVLDTSLANMNAVLHVPGMLANIGRVDGQIPFDFYGDGITPSVARLVDAYDAERVQLAAALGANVPTLSEWVLATYGVKGASTHEIVHRLHHDVYGELPAPRSLTHRFLTEDVPCGAVPVADLSRQLGLDAPEHAALVKLAELVCETDFSRIGWTARALGLEGLTAQEIRSLTLGSGADPAHLRTDLAGA
jgi:opine dehydrogenase